MEGEMLANEDIEVSTDHTSDAPFWHYPLAEREAQSRVKVVSEVVVAGAQLGRTIGFPTANMILGHDVDLEAGIYAVQFIRASGECHFGVASFGRRPTVVENGELILETYVLDFADDLYGETCSVRFVEFLRPELRFDGLEPMIVQIRKDVVLARRVLASEGPIAPLGVADGGGT
ncbi:riboflavin kinase [Sinorhizobium meliloti]|uniref:riboflavin kinase n=1 Tax=Rhizobium meliloti TaxID=382 RepID=UPI00398D1A6C